MNSTEHRGFAIKACAFARLLCQATVLFCFATTTGIAFAQINLPASGYINTIAGTGACGYTGNGGAATSAQLCAPRGVTVDASGNVYIAEFANHVIRKVKASTGAISTIAGTGSGGYSGDGGAATSAQLSLPMGVAFDSSGNFYIADFGNDVIRKVNSSGVISTFAGIQGSKGYTGDGNAATGAQLNNPVGVAVDASGNVYIADSGNDVIRKVTASTGVISTYAGSSNATCLSGCLATSASLNYPWGVAVDASGNVYISEFWGGVVAEVTASTGILNYIAGVGNLGYSGDGGPATSAQLCYPMGVAVDAHGNVYLSDSGNNRIREITASTGVINTIAGNGTGGYAGDGGPANATNAEINNPYALAVDPNGNVYIADTANNVIRAVGGSATTPAISVATSGTPSTYGTAVTFTATVTSGDTNAVTFYSGSTSLGTAEPSSGTATLTTSSLSLGSNSITASIAAGGSYSAATSSAITQTVNRAAPTISAWPTAGAITFGQTLASSTLTGGTASVGGTFAWTTSSAAPNAGTPSENVTFTPTNTTDYTTVSGTVSVTVYQATPTISVSSSGSPTAYGNSVTFMASVTSADTNTVTFYNGSTSLGVATPVSGTATLAINNLPAGSNSITAEIAAGGNYAAANSYAITQTVNQPTASIINTFAGTGGGCGYAGDGGAATSARLCYAQGVAVDASGNVYIADYGNHAIRKVTASTGVIRTIAGTGSGGYSGDGGQATSAQLNLPMGVAVDASGNFYIADFGNDVIRKVNSSGVISTFAGIQGSKGYTGDGGQATSAQLNNPYGVAVDASGNVYIVDSGNSVIRKVTVSTGVISTYAGSSNATCLSGCLATSASLNYPYDVAVDANGNVYTSEYWGGVVAEVTASTGILNYIAGVGNLGYSGDGGPATSAHLDYPAGVAVDAHGNVYIVDEANLRIREITASTGVINTIVGNGTAGYSGDGGLATDAEINYPNGLAVDASGNVYIADLANNVVRVVSGSATTPAISVATSGTPSVYGTAVTFTATVTSGDTNAVTFYSGGTSLGTATPSGGTATLTTSSLSVGSNSITADIAAGGSYSATSSSAITQMVDAGGSNWDTGTVTLTVSNSSGAVFAESTNYGQAATPSSIAEGLAGSNGNVSVTAVDNTLYINSTGTGAATDYSYTVSSSWNSNFANPSFQGSPAGGSLTGGAGAGSGSGPVYTYSASYDSVGNITGYTDSVMGTWGMANSPGTGACTNSNSGYDCLNRLVAAQATAGPYQGLQVNWSYDSFGNRTSEIFSGSPSPGASAPVPPSTVVTPAANNHIQSVQGTTTYSPSYDAAGDVIADPGSGNQYAYDGEGRICAVSGPSGTMGYIYDADGTRVAKGTIHLISVSGQLTLSCDTTQNGFQTTSDYVLGASNEQVTEVGMDANGNMAHQHTNVWAGGKLLATYDDNGLHFYLDDPLGTRRVTTDYAGVIEKQCTSLPFGDGESCAATPSEHLFTGKERDAESGNDYFGARYYASSMGRWISPDEPFADQHPSNPQSWNLYEYGRNNPLTNVDVDGRCVAPALNPGEVGVCVESYIQTARLPGGFPNWLGYGNNRGPVANDSRAGFKTQTLIVVDLPDNLIKYLTKAGPSKTMLGQLPGVANGSLMDVYRDGSDLYLTLSVNGQNGFAAKNLPGPSGTIKMTFKLKISADGHVTVLADSTTKYPSMSIFSYLPDGTVFDDWEQTESGNIDDLNLPGNSGNGNSPSNSSANQGHAQEEENNYCQQYGGPACNP